MNRTAFRPWVVLSVTLFFIIAILACTSDATPATSPSTPVTQSMPTTRPTVVTGVVHTNPDNGGRHLAPGVYAQSYTETPATSGPHWFSPETPVDVPAPARWGVYVFVIPDEVLVHNLEHGGVGIHYDCPDRCDDLVARLESLVPRDPSQYIMSPYRNMPSRIVITAWRRSLYLNEFDETAITEFITNYQDSAPESVKGNSF